MKRIFNSSKAIVFLIAFITLVTFSNCNDEAGPSICVVQVIDSAGNPVEGATVIVHANNSTATIDGQKKTGELRSEQISGSDGNSTHSFVVPGKEKQFNLEAVLEIDVSKNVVINNTNKTFLGRGSVHIYPDKIVTEVVTIR